MANLSPLTATFPHMFWTPIKQTANKIEISANGLKGNNKNPLGQKTSKDFLLLF